MSIPILSLKKEDEQEITTDVLKQMLSDNLDIIFNETLIDIDRKITVIFVEGMVSSQLVDDFVLKPLTQQQVLKQTKTEKDLVDLIMLGIVYHNQRKLCDKLSDSIEDLLSGSAVLVFDDTHLAVTFGSL